MGAEAIRVHQRDGARAMSREMSQFTLSCFRGFPLERCEALLEATEWFSVRPDRQVTRGQLTQAPKRVRSSVALFSGVGSFPNFRGRRVGDDFIIELITSPALYVPELQEVICEGRSKLG